MSREVKGIRHFAVAVAEFHVCCGLAASAAQQSAYSPLRPPTEKVPA